VRFSARDQFPRRQRRARHLQDHSDATAGTELGNPSLTDIAGI
jgi:hypothetical protein